MDSGTLDRERLIRDIAATFKRRDTHGVPESLEPPPDFWEPVFAKLAAECGIDGDINTQFDRVSGNYRNLVGKLR